MNTGLGKAIFRLDENYREITGYLVGKNPAVNLPLKKVPAPPVPAHTEEEGWRALLDDTDVPPSAAAIDSLWVGRHAFDPGLVLAKFDRPLLAIYGEIDWIVPYRENIARLKQCFPGDRRKLLTTVVAYQGEHGTEVKDKYVELAGDYAYWHFYRISPQVQVAIVDFLRKYDLIE